MIVLNFSHPLTSDQLEQIKNIIGNDIEHVVQVHTQFDNEASFVEQLDPLMEQIDISIDTLQTTGVVVNLPALSSITGMVLAKLHGWMGYFPPIIRMVRADTTPPRFDVVEVINLQSIRDKARRER